MLTVVIKNEVNHHTMGTQAGRILRKQKDGDVLTSAEERLSMNCTALNLVAGLSATWHNIERPIRSTKTNRSVLTVVVFASYWELGHMLVFILWCRIIIWKGMETSENAHTLPWSILTDLEINCSLRMMLADLFSEPVSLRLKYYVMLHS